MKVYYDTEFLEDGRTIELISIGLVAEDGRTYYAANRDMPVRRIRKSPWLMQNVVPHLPQGYGDMRNHAPRRWLFHYGDPRVRRHKTISSEVRDFLQATPDLQLWAWYGAYDHVVLCQLWGPMISLPDGVPMWTNDLQQEAVRQGVNLEREVPQEGKAHNALDDARHAKAMGDRLGL